MHFPTSSQGAEFEQLHLDQVNDAAERIVGVTRPLPDGNAHDHRPRPEPITDLGDGPCEIGPFAIQLVDEGHARHLVAVRLMPHRFALRFDPLARAEHHHGTVEHSQAAFHLGREIDVPRRVEQVDVVAVPVEGHAGRVDGDPAFLLFLVAVGLGRPLIHPPHAMLRTAEKQHLLSDGRLARIDVGNDADVTNIFQLTCHTASPLSRRVSTGKGTRWGPRRVRPDPPLRRNRNAAPNP